MANQNLGWVGAANQRFIQIPCCLFLVALVVALVTALVHHL